MSPRKVRPAKAGKVVLVGAGPGSPDLLTLRAARALGEADLVLYDALVDPAALELAPRAARFCVGKRAGRASVSQDTIHALLVRSARSGKNVVRLKCGDPFVLGRGGEEVLALGAAGVHVEVVPGVSSAVAGPADAGIPVTLRGVASGFLVLSAVPEEPCLRILARQDPESITCVLLMAMGARGAIAAGLAAAGWPAHLPAAIVLGAHTERARSWTGRLDELADFVPPPDCADLPGLVVLGNVVGATAAMRAAMDAAVGEGRAHDGYEEREVRLGSA